MSIEPGDVRAAHLAGGAPLNTAPPSCPGCTKQGSLSLLQPGRPSTVQGLAPRPDLWGCAACGWQGWGTQLEERLGLVVDPVLGIHVDSEALACWREQEGMEVARTGGSQKGRRTPKPGDRELTKRPEQEPPAGTRPRASTTEKRSVIKTFRFTPETAAFLEREAKAGCRPMQAIVDEALAEWAQRHYCVELGV